MVAEGRYVYCIVEGAPKLELRSTGLSGRPAQVVEYKDIGAVVSSIPYKEVEANLDNIMTHQKVVDASKKRVTTLPVKFGVIFRTEDGVKTLLSGSYPEYKNKLAKFKGMDEYGVKILLTKDGMQRLKTSVGTSSREISKMQKQISRSGQGKSYLLKLRMDEALRTESYKKIDSVSRDIHDELSRGAQSNTILKSEHEQIVLNAAYLIKKEEGEAFMKRAARLGEEYAGFGLIVHASGPWAPYSFC